MSGYSKHPADFISKDTWTVFAQGATVIGNAAKESFELQLFNDCVALQIESPIEQILYCALQTLREIDAISSDGLRIISQQSIGKYWTDFEVQYARPGEDGPPLRSVLVECDSQQFHERTERERRYEKARDRYVQIKGYKVFHFTGKEILENPFKIASEIIGFLTDMPTETIYEYFEAMKDA